MRKLTCYEALLLASKCVRSARALRGIALRSASCLLLNAATYIAFADERRAQAPYCGSSIKRLLAAVDSEVDFQMSELARAVSMSGMASHMAEA